jgi:hypothetical protein
MTTANTNFSMQNFTDEGKKIIDRLSQTLKDKSDASLDGELTPQELLELQKASGDYEITITAISNFVKSLIESMQGVARNIG